MYLVFTRTPGGVTVRDSGLCCCVPCLSSAFISRCLLMNSCNVSPVPGVGCHTQPLIDFPIPGHLYYTRVGVCVWGGGVRALVCVCACVCACVSARARVLLVCAASATVIPPCAPTLCGR